MQLHEALSCDQTKQVLSKRYHHAQSHRKLLERRWGEQGCLRREKDRQQAGSRFYYSKGITWSDFQNSSLLFRAVGVSCDNHSLEGSAQNHGILPRVCPGSAQGSAHAVNLWTLDAAAQSFVLCSNEAGSIKAV